jgi:hypothetical protein
MRLALLLTLCLGCTAANSAGPDPQTLPVDLDDDDDDARDDSAPAKAGSCVLATDSWAPANPDEGTMLRLAVDELPFIVVRQGSAELKLDGGIDPNALSVLVTRHGVTISGLIRVNDVGLRLKRAVVFEGVAVPQPSTVLAWGGFSAAGKPVLVHSLREGTEPDKLRAEVDCGDITLDGASYDPEGPIKRGEGRWGRLMLDAHVPLMTEPRGAAAAFLQGDDVYDTIVREVAFDGGYSRIVWLRQREVVFGWIPGSALAFPESPPSPMPENPPYPTEPPAATGTVKCGKLIDLFATANGKPPRKVGTIAAGSTFDVGGSSYERFSDIAALAAFEQAFYIWGDGLLMVKTDDIAGCT